jgi:hypothetical protein
MPELEQQLQNQDRRSVRPIRCVGWSAPGSELGLVADPTNTVLSVQYEKLWLWHRLGKQVHAVTPVY